MENKTDSINTKRLIMGIYRVFDANDPKAGSFVGFSRNVEGTIKRLRFELTLNACSYKPLQEFYSHLASPTIELYEKYDPEGGTDGMSDTEIDAHLYALLLKAKNSLGERTQFIQTPGALNW